MTAPSSVHAILNPRSARGKTGGTWPEIKAALNSHFERVDVSFTDAVGAATKLTRQAIDQGADLILAIGGDGTINEVVNGFHRDGQLINDKTELAILTIGTGCDLRKTLGIPSDWRDALDGIVNGSAHGIDIGKIKLQDNGGTPTTRYFINVASFGLGGAVAHRVNRAKLSKAIGGSFSFYWNTIRTALTYKRQPVRMYLDDADPVELDISIVAVANAQYFGGGMWVAPMAKPDDGVFEVITLHQSNFFGILKASRTIYRGDHLKLENVGVYQAKKLKVETLGQRPILMEVDGETPGRLPATFEVLPRAISMRY